MTRGRRWVVRTFGLALAAVGCGDLALTLQLPDASAPDVGATSSTGTASPPVFPCTTKSQCADTGVPMCNVDAGACVQCLSSDDCSGSTPHCVNGACVSCTADAGCSATMTCNTHIPRCATICTSGAQCDGTPCSPDYGYCVECLYNSDCTNKALPLCFNPPAFGLCVACLSSADCDGGACGPAMRCE